LLVILNEFVDFSPDDLALVGLLARGDATLEEVPVDLGGHLLLAPTHRLSGFAVAEHLEAYELVDVTGTERRLIELHAELLHPDSSDVDHVGCPLPTASRGQGKLRIVVI